MIDLKKQIEKLKGEEHIQASFVLWLEELKEQGKNIKYTAIPNSTFTLSMQAKTKNILMGLRPGLCDMFLIVNGVPLFLELKTSYGKVSPSQKEWIAAINSTQNIRAHVAYSLEEAKSIIEEYAH
ncbi:MAG TPA: VRR-NUC domain-containing protein [Vampirovibrionales bacterium]